MAFQAISDYNNRPGSRVALNHPHHYQKQQQPGALQPIDDLDGLDNSLLDSAMISPASAGDRRDSFANSTALFSPQSTNWEDFSTPAMDRSQSTSNNPFFERNNNPYTRIEQPHIATFSQQQSSTWPLVDRTADSRTPFAHQAHDVYASDFEPAQPYMAHGSSVSTYNGLPNMPSNVRPSSIFPPNSQGIETPNPLSPSSGDKWMTLNNDIDPRPLPKRMRPNSPPRSFSPNFARARGDGIRKKNARFEIPPERNLNTIDQLIAEAATDEVVKELKQQKRLLRNRQAALDSRQRKKKHTEDLEKEKGDWQERMAGLEEDLANMRLQAEAYAMDRVEMEQQFGQAQQQIQGLIYEKEDLVAEHTRETGELRKKINILTEKLSAKASGTATVTPCSTDFTDFASDMNSLTMDQDEWNNYIFVDPLFQDQDATPHHQQPAQSNNSLVVASRPKPQQLLDADKPVASGLLLMLLLCGAYVATQSSGSQAPPGFRVTGEVRAGAQAVLNDILQEASPAAGQSAHHVVANHMNGLEPGPSAVAASWQPKATLSQAEFASISNPSGLGLDASHLDHLHHNLVMPTKDQEAEQLFSLTANQYNSLTSTEFNRPAYHMASDTPPTTDEGSTSPTSGRKTLAQALQSRHDDHSKAAVYTRSLLGEQIPADIVKEFQKMVRDSESSGQHIVKSET